MKNNLPVRVIYKDLGLSDYKETWDLQENLFNEILKGKIANKAGKSRQDEPGPDYLLFCEHPHVFTLGKSGKTSNMLADTDLLSKKGAQFYKINRGGDVTYHGPGQIVGYPVLDLEKFGLGIKEYIHKLEEIIIDTLRYFSIDASRLKNATGVWIDAENPVTARKICAIGVRASRYVTMHGFAFNINTDLSYYQLINPCGYTDKGVTSMQNEINEKADMNEVKKLLKTAFIRHMGMDFSLLD